ncbi:MAG: pyruvate formate lyase family protein, partial [Propionicimonas sp.]
MTTATRATACQSLSTLPCPPRIGRLRDAMLAEPRVVSAAQALITTRVYREHAGEPVAVRRSLALAAALRELPIAITAGELVVGNRTPSVRAGVITPEAGASWIDREIETLPTRPQDRFEVDPETIRAFREDIRPAWRGASLEDVIRGRHGAQLDEIAKVVKINQKDHAQGHICPNVARWLATGPAGLARQAAVRGATATGERADFYRAVEIAMTAVLDFLHRYADLADDLASGSDPQDAADLHRVAEVMRALADRPARSFHEAVQSLWVLFVVLHT